MVHITDWLPTFLSWAGASHLATDHDLDGLDQTEALQTGELVRPKKGDTSLGDKALVELEGGQVVAAKRATRNDYKRDKDKEGAGDDSGAAGGARGRRPGEAAPRV